jgi:hypothetical protein
LLREGLVIMAFSRLARPAAALALALSGLALASIGAGGAHAQAFGTNGSATTNWQAIDSNGVHPEPGFNCDTPGETAWCGPGARSSTTGFSTSNINTAQGHIAGSISATNAAPPARVRSSASADGSWWDTFTVDGGSLPSDTIVDLRMMVNLTVSGYMASAAAPPPYTNVLASINLGGPDAPAIAGMNEFGDGSYSSVGFLSVQVDTPFVLWGRFFTQSNVNDFPFPDLGTAAGEANYYVDVVGIEGLHASGAMGFASLTGADALPRLITASGHDYSFLAQGGGVPEPAAWTMLIAGFSLAGAMARRRRAAGGVAGPLHA